ncbi:MAG: translation initiation factor IF-2 [Xanthomonadales bacterium]|nr:translation initiation factor IF-2 [Xanthomonadales bacterium]
MSQVTVKQLAEVVGIPVERLIEQLGEAGMQVSDPEQSISNKEKTDLLNFLRKRHGKDKKDLGGPNKVTLKRRSHEELKVSAGTGRAKTVNVEVRKKRTYVKRSFIEEQEQADPMREEAARKLQESQEARAEEELRAKEVEAERQRQAEEKERQEAEEQARREAEAKEREEEERTRREAEEQARREAEEKARKEAEEAQRQAAERARLEATQREQEKKKKKERAGRKPDTRYGRSELHVAAGKSGQRRSRKPGRRKSYETSDQHGFSKPTAPVVREVEIPETISVGDLAQKMAIKSTEVIKELMRMGMMVTINQPIDQDTAILVVEEMGHTAVAAKDTDIETQLREEYQEEAGETAVRPPVVTVMGHVDHGKTSLLDHIRHTRVAAGEAGGITQHIGAYHVKTEQGVVSFLDTPGHAAFTAMRARGAKATDIVILVVAADDGVKPQTIEAIQHARAAEVPIIVAVNKIDKPEADVDRTKQELSKHEVIPEDWGGEDIFVNVSALTGEGIDQLLESILLQAELLELTATPDARASGVVVESALDKGRGPIATVLVQNGTLKQGDMLLAGQEFGRVRAMFNESGEAIKEAGPSIPAQILGLSGTPMAGDEVLVVENERRAKEAAELRHTKERDARLAQQQAAKLESLFSQMGEGEQVQVNLMIKADVQGSAEALRDALTRMSNELVKVNVIGSGVGGITQADASLAQTSNAIVIGFNVRADAAARRVIKEADVDLRYYSVIYDAIDDVKAAIAGALGTEMREEIIGLAEVKDVFRSSKIGAIAGCLVVEGVVKRNNPIRVLRDNVVIFEGELESLRRFKDDVNEVQSGTECGIGVKQYNDVKEGDQIECFERVEVQRTLDD